MPSAVVFVNGGPGYYLTEVYWIRVAQGGHVLFVNNGTQPHEYSGAGFSSGLVPPGGAVDVAGVPALKVGHYEVYDGTWWVGDLYIDPNPLVIG
jgi:hypothetical protein